MKTTVTWALAALGALQACSCDTNQSGDLRAQRVGDLSHALGAREPALKERAATCDLGVPEVDPVQSRLRRRPYLQKMTAQSVTVVWTTDAGATDGTVVVSRTDGAIAGTAAAERDLGARPQGGAVQWSAAIAALDPDTAYCYELQVGGVALRRGGFRTAPLAGSGSAVRFVALGDSGNGGADQRAVYEQMRRVPFDFMAHLGDIAYDVGSRGQLESYFFGIYADVLEDIAVFPASGNHEYETEDAAPFRETFVLPENGGPGGLERWYSFDFGDVHFVALDTERTGAVQAAWLDADLTANRLPWTIVYFHKPPFSSGEHGSDGNAQRYFVPVLTAHHVPLVLSGHDHDYERTNSLDGVTYVVSGGGGRGTRAVGQSSFTAFSEAVCHFVYVVVAGNELTLHAIDGVGQEFDSLAITLR